MNWLSIINFAVQNAPGIIKVITELTGSLKQTTAPKDGAIDTDEDQPAKRGPSETVKTLQKLLNEFLKPQPDLEVDGWLGPKTEKAINDALKLAKPYLAMLGK